MKKFWKTFVAALMVFALALALIPSGDVNAKAKKKATEVKATSITFKTTTGGDFVAGVCKMKISFKLNNAASKVTVNIFDASDDVVCTKTISKKIKKNKAYTYTWDGKNTKGKSYVPEGYYSVEIKVGDVSTNSADLDVVNGYVKLIRKSGFAGGDGSEKKPYQVKTLAQLKNMEEHNGMHFKQTADIDIDYEDFSGMFAENNMFTGSYDGGDHSISNGLFTEGLFHFIGEGAEVKNLTLSGCSTDGRYAGILCRANHGTIKKCKVSSCNAAQGSYAGEGVLGGIAGTNYSKITNCEVSGFAAMNNSAKVAIGGICGNNQGNIVQSNIRAVELSSCYSHDAGWSNDGDAGGLAGINSGNITNCSVIDANVEGLGSQGLFVGKNNGVVSGCTPKSSDIKLVGKGNDAV